MSTKENKKENRNFSVLNNQISEHMNAPCSPCVFSDTNIRGNSADDVTLKRGSDCQHSLFFM